MTAPEGGGLEWVCCKLFGERFEFRIVVDCVAGEAIWRMQEQGSLPYGPSLTAYNSWRGSGIGNLRSISLTLGFHAVARLWVHVAAVSMITVIADSTQRPGSMDSHSHPSMMIVRTPTST